MNSVYILWSLIILLIIILIKLLNINKNYIISFFITLLIIIFFVNLKIAMASAIDGCKLWFNAILPTVLPFLVICNMLIYYDGISLYSKFLGPLLCRPLGLSKNCSFPMTASILCGYPLGAKYSSDLYNLKCIDRKEYTRLVNIATNCGPLFILGPVATVMLGNIKLGYILLIANYLSPFLIGKITKKNNKKTSSLVFTTPSFNLNFGEKLKNSLEQSIKTTLSIGGFIVLFSVFIGIIKNSSSFLLFINTLERLLSIPENSVYASILGSIEITKGCSILSSLSMPFNIKMSTISFLCSFSGICIIGQVSSFISKDKISLLRYSFYKLLQGIFSFVITYIVTTFFCSSISASSIKIPGPNNTLFKLYIIPLIFIIISFLIFKIFNIKKSPRK